MRWNVQLSDDVDGASLKLLSENREIYFIQSAITKRGRKSSFLFAERVRERCFRLAKVEKKIP